MEVSLCTPDFGKANNLDLFIVKLQPKITGKT